MRYVCQFSCGAASAVATKLTIAAHPGDEVLIVNAFVVEEHEDNRRFAKDCEAWFGRAMTVIRDEKYGASTDEVWRRKRYMKGLQGAPCSGALKREPLGKLQRPGDRIVIGFTIEERDRFEDLCDHFPEINWESPLIERGLTHSDCLSIVMSAGITLPAMYLLGYSNANCIGCPKGGQAYWQSIRHDFPERFAAILAMQESIGEGAYFLQFRSGPRKGERMGLKDLPPGRGNMTSEGGFSCSFVCDQISRELRSNL